MNPHVEISSTLNGPKAPIPFRGFDERREDRIYEHGVLPHWRQHGCAYFVTFRLADSIPEGVLRQLEYERTSWLRTRGIDPLDHQWKRRFSKLPAKEKQLYERLVGRSVSRSLDECHGSCVLREPRIAEIVAAALDHFHGTRVWTGDFVIMPNHVHALLTPFEGFELEELLHSIKSYTAKQINCASGANGTLWQKESHDHIVRDIEQLEAFQQYIAANPEKAKLRSGQYILSQATYCIPQ